MKISDITPLGGGMHELKKGFVDQKLRKGNLVEVQLGGIETAPPSLKLPADVKIL
jgi:hypothetical protein